MLHAGDNIVEGIPVEVIRKRIRRINLRVTPEGTVRLSIPAYWATLREGEAFLRSKLDWVRKTRSAILARPAPSRAPESEAELESLRALLGELNASWTARLRLEPFEWKLRKVKTFWGCCNWRRRLVTYNVELARAPRELVEYVVVHELTHFDAHDHGPKFYALMDARLPDWQGLRRELNAREWAKVEGTVEEPFLPPPTGSLVQGEFFFE